jgi:hypothetical protein
MPDWSAPFHLPKFTDAEFKAMREKYVAKHGYTVTVPRITDIIIVDTFERMTDLEKKWWRNREYKRFRDYRYWEIKEYKQRKKDRFLAMLASPTPEIVTNFGSIMTSIDDCQDALATLGFIGKMLIKIAPKALAKTFLGPLGWISTAADLMNFCTTMTALVRPNMTGKRARELISSKNPLSKTAQARIRKNLLDGMPTSSDIIQGLQVTGDIFGFGICLGPILGLAQDLLSGLVRLAMGQEVSFRTPKIHLPEYMKQINDGIRAAGYVLSAAFQTDEPALTDVMLAAYVGNQAIAPWLKDWHPVDNVDDIEQLHFMAPIPKDPLTIEIIEELGFDVLSTCGWPHNGQMWTSFNDFMAAGRPNATYNLMHMMEINKDNRRGELIGHLGNEIALQSLANWAGEENVSYDYTAPEKFVYSLFLNGYGLDPDTGPQKLGLLEGWLRELQSINDSANFAEIRTFCKNNGVSLVPLSVIA